MPRKINTGETFKCPVIGCNKERHEIVKFVDHINCCIRRRIKDIDRMKNHILGKDYKEYDESLPFKCNTDYCRCSFSSQSELIKHKLRCSILREQMKICPHCGVKCIYELVYRLHPCTAGFKICDNPWCNFPVRTTDNVDVGHIEECINYARCSKCMTFFLFRDTPYRHKHVDEHVPRFRNLLVETTGDKIDLVNKVGLDDMTRIVRGHHFLDYLTDLEIEWFKKCKEINEREVKYSGNRKYYRRYALEIFLTI